MSGLALMAEDSGAVTVEDCIDRTLNGVTKGSIENSNKISFSQPTSEMRLATLIYLNHSKVVDWSLIRSLGAVIAKPPSMFTILLSLMFAVFAVGIVIMLELKKASVGTEDKDGFSILPNGKSPHYRLAPVKCNDLEAAALMKKSHR